MSNVNNVPGILDVIKSITANGESGRLEISSPGTHGSGTHGVLLFTEGKLVDARLESLSGFQAVNAAVSLRDVEFSFDHVVPAPHAVAITPSERVVLKRFFGIEAAQIEEPMDLVEPNPGWNETPEQVVPLTEVEELPQTDLEETPTVEVAAIRSVPVVEGRQFAEAEQVGTARTSGSARWFAFLLRPQVALGLVLLLALVVGAMSLRARFQTRQEAAAVASVVASESKPVAEDSSVVTSESRPVASNSGSVAGAPAEVKPIPRESPSVTLSQRPSATVSQQQNARVRDDAVSQPLSAEQSDTSDDRDAEVHDLNGEWRLINVVEKTNYKSFHNMQLGFRLKINQKGKEFTATGEKFSENGQTLPADSRTPITLTGSIEGDKVIATFVEDGVRRRTNGRFEWTLQGGDKLTGTFVSTAGNNRGRSAVTKEQ
ncbi:MAG: DUF4388 domain-containing protein [Acidobacteria bacterium]|nr:DUF4388 domain-containing protein [Acidobacteriota bacterium]